MASRPPARPYVQFSAPPPSPPPSPPAMICVYCGGDTNGQQCQGCGARKAVVKGCDLETFRKDLQLMYEPFFKYPSLYLY